MSLLLISRRKVSKDALVGFISINLVALFTEIFVLYTRNMVDGER